ncbi:MAG: hypothetical protein HY974_01760 [Candidatus Kerfeldbacteria bacterium]|nr:hypothetical protein [Candidatus Kerfeldbacteria bacterium]
MKLFGTNQLYKLRSLLTPSLLVIVTALLFINQWQMVVIHQLMPVLPAEARGTGSAALSATNFTDSSGILPHGVPARYGQELGVNFDAAAEAMPILENFDRGSGAITLSGQLQQRYIAIASRTACEFCCGAKTLVSTLGQPACGCAHSAAMRGLALYLLQQHPDMSDDEILAEVNRWKAAFFPRATVERASGQTGAAQPGTLPSQVGGC